MPDTMPLASSCLADDHIFYFWQIMDIWGRPEAFAIMVASMTIGQIMLAGSNNPQTYAAAEVFNQLG